MPDVPAERGQRPLQKTHTQAEIDAFIERMNASVPITRGRLIFALDATMSRQPTWDLACQLQAEMFREAAKIGGLEVQLVFFRGLVGECKATKWKSNANELIRIMSGISCATGETQIEKVLGHVKKEAQKLKLAAMVYVGDQCEENIDALAPGAAELGRLNVPAFMFQEGDDQYAESIFHEIAKLSHGAYCRFDSGSAQQLRDLLRAVAAFAAGGMAALAARKDTSAVRLLTQLRGS
jgi:hypothetical protein